MSTTNERAFEKIRRREDLSDDFDTGPRVAIEFEELVVSPRLVESWDHTLARVRQLSCRASDVLLCSYPKCGTHWLRALVTALVSPARAPTTLLELGAAGGEDTGLPPSTRIVVTHLRPQQLPETVWSSQCKLALIVRNPKDAAVSLFYHLKNSAHFESQQTWEDFYRTFLTGAMPYGAYFEYLKEWDTVIRQKHINIPDRLRIIYYEDLKQNYYESVKALSEYFGVNNTVDELRRVCDKCSIDRLRQTSQMKQTLFHPSLKGSDGTSVVFRKGVVGDWKNHFTEAQSEEFDSAIKERLKNSLFSFTYE